MKTKVQARKQGASGDVSSAIVLAGGGARGAYETGVIRYLFEEFSPPRGGDPLFDIFTGTSAGALNACTLASMAHSPQEGARELIDYWRSIRMETILRFGTRELLNLPSVVLGRKVGFDFLRTRERPPRPPASHHAPVSGVFSTSPLYRDMRSRIPWDLLQQNIRSGVVRGLAVCATEVCTSKSVVFYQVHRQGNYRASRDSARVARPVIIQVEHAMASAAIPFLFPAIQIEGVCHVDGALRQNAPVSPAMRMGAGKILVVGLALEPESKYQRARMGCRRNPYPGSLFLLGRTVKAVMDGTLDHELHRTEMFNRLILDGQDTYGESFLKNLNRSARRFRNADYRLLRVQHIRPSRSLNDLAIEALREAPEELDMPGPTGRLLRSLLSSAPMVESELSSFLMFMPTYIRKLMDLGTQDAKNQRKELSRFFSAPVQ
jgi:NTE family protein